MSIDDRSGGRARHLWPVLLWLLPVMLSLGLARLALSLDVYGQAPDEPAVVSPAVVSPESTSPLGAYVDHASVKWEHHPIEPAQPAQSVAAYERE